MGESWGMEADEILNKPKLESKVTTVSTASSTSTSSASAKESLPVTALTDFLDLDDHPNFILDLDASSRRDGLVYYNARLEGLQHAGSGVGRRVIEFFENGLEDKEASSLLDWAFTTQTSKQPLPPTTHNNIRWSAKTIRNRWRVLTGEIVTDPSDGRRPSISLENLRIPRSLTELVQPRMPTTTYPVHRTLDGQFAPITPQRAEGIPNSPSQDSQSDPAKKSTVWDGYESLGRLDVTGPSPGIPLTPYIELFRQFDWAATPMGPITSWSPLFRRMCNVLLVDPRPAAIFWGSEKSILYNESYVLVTGQRHPYMLGKPFSISWPEVSEYFLPQFDKIAATGKALVIDDAQFFLYRHGYIEETYYSLSIAPFELEHGEVAFYNATFDTARQVITDRRMVFLLRLGQILAASRELKGFWQQLVKGLDVSNPDIPFMLLYSAGADAEHGHAASSAQGASYQDWELEGSVGVPDTFTTGRKAFGSGTADVEDFIPGFKTLIQSSSPTLLRLEDGSLPELFSTSIPVTLNEGTHKCDAAVFLPICSTGENALGFLVIGINPQKRYDEDYSLFVELLNRQVATSMASTRLVEEEVRRSKMVSEQADLEKSILSRLIEVQTREALQVETRFRSMADLAPVGMFHVDAAGVILYANNDYYTITEHPRDVAYPMSWYKVIHIDDYPVMDREWATLMAGGHVSFELRLKRPFVAEDMVGDEKVEGITWIIAGAYAEKDADGNVVGVLGCITDISRQKWSEGFQNRKRMEAIELKRQQENFIDMTSHEIRNPLSAILQSADWIATSISEAHESENMILTPDLIESYTDAAQTIMLCAQHQSRIIDDILTLSKLDSDLLIITPIEVQPTSVVQTALKMFSSELNKSEINFNFNVEDSYVDLAVDWVKLDPSRLLQVLINLTTNAIKFTQTEPTRQISISIGASLDLPATNNGVNYLPRGDNLRDLTQGAAWGTGEIIYLSIGVTDTGRGLDELERSLLFKRFSQSSPRTHVQYGGSGLGLFISRRLTELQGGQIGVASKAGVGSTFAFFVRARRCEKPATHLPSVPASIKVAEQTRTLTKKALSQIQNTIIPPAAATSSPSAHAATPIPSTELSPPDCLPAVSKHVLVVEDNLVNQKVLSKQLVSAGCVVHVANHGAEALAFLESSRFWFSKATTGIPLSVILMDLEMPTMDGLTCVKIIRTLQTEGKITAHVPVIAVTANARTEQIKIATDAGMDSVVTKPFKIGELMPEIERWCLGGESRGRLHCERSSSEPLLGEPLLRD